MMSSTPEDSPVAPPIDLSFTRSSTFHDPEELSVSGSSRPISLGSIFVGDPIDGDLQVERRILLDTNVFSELRNHPGAAAATTLVHWSRSRGVRLDPTFALMEQRVSHGAAQDALRRYIAVLKAHYDIVVTDEQHDEIEQTLVTLEPAFSHDVRLLEDYVTLIKAIAGRRGRPLEKAKFLADEIRTRDLPRFVLAYLFGCISFLALGADSPVARQARSKIQSDMTIAGDRLKEAAKRHNLARDLALFQFVVEGAFMWPGRLSVLKIASRDSSFAAYSKFIKCCAVRRERLPTGKLTTNGAFGTPPDAGIDPAWVQQIMAVYPAGLGPSSADVREARRVNLAKCAQDYSL